MSEPVGDQFRKVLAERKADDEASQKAKAASCASTLSDWFNKIAQSELPAQAGWAVEQVAQGKGCGGPLIIFKKHESELGMQGADKIDFETLPGFQALDKKCKEMNIDFAAVAGVDTYAFKGFNDPSRTHYPYILVGIDLSKPYQGRNKDSSKWEDSITAWPG